MKKERGRGRGRERERRREKDVHHISTTSFERKRCAPDHLRDSLSAPHHFQPASAQ